MALIRRTIVRANTGASLVELGSYTQPCLNCGAPLCDCGAPLVQLAGIRPASFKCSKCEKIVGLLEVVQKTRKVL